MFSGSIVAIVTPFNSDLSVNYNKLTELLNWHVEQGTDGIVILGTTGEAPTLTEDERLRVFEHTVQVINHRIPVIAGTGSNNTVQTMLFSKKVEALGVDGLLIVSPYYNKGNRQGLIEHFTQIADHVSIPIILYNVPGRTGINLPIDVVVELANHPNIIGVKEASSNLSYAVELKSQLPDEFLLFSGNDDIVLPILSIGGTGVISVAANIIPKQMHDLVASYHAGDIKTAQDIQLGYLKLINTLFIEVNPIPVKEALNLMGKEVGGFRLPLYPLTDENRVILEQVLRGYDL